LGSRVEGSLTEPIVNASRPCTLAGLSLTVLKFSSEDPLVFQLSLLVGAIMFLFSSLFIFFYTLYPTRRGLWVMTSTTFLVGLCCAILSSIILLMMY
jgi:hypothetical protein